MIEVVIGGVLWRYRIASGWYIFLEAKPVPPDYRKP